MKQLNLFPLGLLGIVTVACNGQSIPSGSSSLCNEAEVGSPSNEGGKKDARATKSYLALADSGETQASPLGGLLVFDALDSASYAEKGYAKADFKPDQKCSATFEFFNRGGSYVTRLLTTEQCYTAFYRASRNQRILVNLPGSAQYLEIKANDERFDKAARFLTSLDGFTPKFRENELVQFTGRSVETLFGFYTDDVKGMSPEEGDAFRAAFCYGEKTPTPKECLWPQGMHFDEVPLKAEGVARSALDGLVAHTQSARESARRALFANVYPSLLKETTLFSDRMVAVSQGTGTMEAVTTMHNFLACDVTNARTKCSGMDRAALDAAAVGIADIFAPEWKTRVETAARATADRKSRVTALFDESGTEFVAKVVRPHFAPALESYIELRKLLAANTGLLSVATNYVDPSGKDVDALAFKSLSPSAQELAGIALSVDSNGNVLLSHPGKAKNRNLTLDGHRGSVLTLGGLPLLAFDPHSIDQSDATSRMPIPKTSTKASSTSSKAPEEKSKTTAGEGKSGSGC